MVQTQLIIEFATVAVHLVVDVPVVQLQGPQVQFSGCGRLCDADNASPDAKVKHKD